MNDDLPPDDELALRRARQAEKAAGGGHAMVLPSGAVLGGERYRWDAVMDSYTHPNCRCVVTPLEELAPVAWWRRALTWLHVRYILWQYDRNKRRGLG